MKRALIFVALTAISAAAAIQSPSQFLGFDVGADRTLADYRQMVSYFRALSAASPRVQIETLGKTTLGEDLIMAVISSEGNMHNLPRIKSIAKQLADPGGLTDQQVDALVREGKSIVVVTCNIHSSEIASSQMAMEWAYALATANDPETKRRLDNAVLLLVPSLNPDGQIMITDYYRKFLGTRYTGWWKNVTGLLLETASARIATPSRIEPTELRGGQKGLIEYKATINHPNPWPGGTWRMRDIMDYERIASDALLEIATNYRDDLLRDVTARARAAVTSGGNAAYRIPHNQRDWPTAQIMADILLQHGVEID